jgi:hypothetical protein
MDALTQAKEFFQKWKDAEWGDDLREAYDAVSKEVQKLFNRMRKAAFFDPKNEVADSRKEVLSASGKYKLVISRFATKPGSWNYSQGVVYRKADDNPIATVQRNYGAFPNLFVEGHPNGHDYLVCGEDYQGQTVIELDTGARRDLMSDGSDKGFGFCWASYTFNAANQLLVVDGCHWACPYEFRFYDFSDPMRGWPEVETEEMVDADDKKAPELADDGTLKCFKTRYLDDEDEEDSDEEKAPKDHAPIVDVIQTYKRDGLKFKLVEEWVSDYERDQRIKRDEAEKRWQEWKANFKATDPLYLAYAELMKDQSIDSSDYESIGQTYDGWGDEWKGYEKRWCRRIVTHKGKKGPTIDLEWAVETGPIKLVLYKDGNSDGHKFFEHSVEGMRLAFAFAKEYARAPR